LLKFRERIQGISKEALGKSLLLSLWNNYGVLTREERGVWFWRRKKEALTKRSSHQGAIEILESLSFNWVLLFFLFNSHLSTVMESKLNSCVFKVMLG
jgi:hypothetical protein